MYALKGHLTRRFSINKVHDTLLSLIVATSWTRMLFVTMVLYTLDMFLRLHHFVLMLIFFTIVSSALYVVDLVKFRQSAAGDNLRVFYESLSKDPNSLSNLDQVSSIRFCTLILYWTFQLKL